MLKNFSIILTKREKFAGTGAPPALTGVAAFIQEGTTL